MKLAIIGAGNLAGIIAQKARKSNVITALHGKKAQSPRVKSMCFFQFRFLKKMRLCGYVEKMKLMVLLLQRN